MLAGNDIIQFGKNLSRTVAAAKDAVADWSPSEFENALRNGTVQNFVPPLVEGIEKAMDRLYNAGTLLPADTTWKEGEVVWHKNT